MEITGIFIVEGEVFVRVFIDSLILRFFGKLIILIVDKSILIICL